MHACLPWKQKLGDTLPPAALQKRYPGRPLIHQNWLYGSLCHGRMLEPSSFYITERCPLPTYNGVAGSWASQTQGTQA
jgi:hypothetical protein